MKKQKNNMKRKISPTTLNYYLYEIQLDISGLHSEIRICKASFNVVFWIKIFQKINNNERVEAIERG